MLNQVELTLFTPRCDVTSYCRAQGVAVQGVLAGAAWKRNRQTRLGWLGDLEAVPEEVLRAELRRRAVRSRRPLHTPQPPHACTHMHTQRIRIRTLPVFAAH
jgi:hypothetical protein